VNASTEAAGRIERQLLSARGFDTWGSQRLKGTTKAVLLKFEPGALKQARRHTVRNESGVFVDAKTRGVWYYEMTDEGVYTWTSRTGQTYVTYPPGD